MHLWLFYQRRTLKSWGACGSVELIKTLMGPGLIICFILFILFLTCLCCHPLVLQSTCHAQAHLSLLSLAAAAATLLISSSARSPSAHHFTCQSVCVLPVFSTYLWVIVLPRQRFVSLNKCWFHLGPGRFMSKFSGSTRESPSQTWNALQWR